MNWNNDHGNLDIYVQGYPKKMRRKLHVNPLIMWHVLFTMLVLKALSDEVCIGLENNLFSFNISLHLLL